MKRTAMTWMLGLVAALLWPALAFAQPAEKVVLQLKWEHEFQFAGYYAALWQGYYAEEGLDVELRSAITPERQFLASDAQVRSGVARTSWCSAPSSSAHPWPCSVSKTSP